METIYAYPGRFSPPALGHLEIAKRSAEIFPRITIICSRNDNKADMFSEAECKQLWQSYALPDNTDVLTFEEFKDRGYDHKQIVLIRGIRDYGDIAYENEMLRLNHTRFGIDKYFYLLSSCKHRDISATRVRELAASLALEEMAKLVSPLVITELLTKALGQKSLRLVVGKPASGKSTFLGMLSSVRDDIVHINTDLFNKELKPILFAHFGQTDLVKIALKKPEELKQVIATPWIELLKTSLRQAKKNSHVFVEAAYGLQEDKPLFNLVGGNVLYFGCKEQEDNLVRLKARETEHMAPFVSSIPGIDESQRIANKHGLKLQVIETDGKLDDLQKQAASFAQKLC